MKNTILTTSHLMVFGIPLTIILGLVLLAGSSTFEQSPEQLSIGITLDLIITVPVIYFLLIRKKEIPKSTVVAVFIAGMLIAGFILPVGHQGILTSIKTFVLPIVELCILAVAIFKVRKVVKRYKAEKDETMDFYSALYKVTTEIFSEKLGALLASEIAVIYYSLLVWKSKTLQENEYSYHKKSGIILILYTLIALTLIETLVFHIIILQWNVTIAWLLTILSLYTCLQIIALIRSMSRSPIVINQEENELILSYGFINKTTISLDHIERIELRSRSLPGDEKLVKLSPLGLLDGHNIILHLKSENEMRGFFGIKKKFNAIAIYVDKKEKFVAAINQK